MKINIILILILSSFNVLDGQNYGLTVIVHGYQTTFFGSNPPDWTFKIAKSIKSKLLAQGGKAKILVYDKSTGSYTTNSNVSNELGGENGGETILVFNWASESNFNIAGYSEAAGDALFASLIQGSQSGLFQLVNPHFIGHSRGCVVVTETVKRIIKLGVNVDQVTYLDAHDWGVNNSIASDMDDNNPNYIINNPIATSPNNGVITWQNVFYDNYWQDNPPPVGKPNLTGRELLGAMNFHWNYNDLNLYLYHTNIHEDGYKRTIDDPNHKMQGGYKFSRLSNGTNLRPPVYGKEVVDYDYFKHLTAPSKGINRIIGIINGGFDRGAGKNIPGWEEHGGSGNAHLANTNGKNAIILSSQFNSRTHNRMYIPKTAKKISFLLYVTTPNPNSYITVKLNNSIIYKDTLNRSTSGFIKIKTDEITSFQGTVATLAVNISSGIPCVIYVTDFEFNKDEAGASSLFLMDVSGSMEENNKIGQARQAALSTINTIKQESQQSNKSPEIGIMVFSGSCTANPTTLIQDFTTDLDEAANSIKKIPAPNGATPLPQAVERAKETLQKRLSDTGQSCGSLIILGDGQSSCGTIIPPDAFAGVKGKQKVCGQQAGSNSFNINLYTVGFGISPGSVAERELQYLSNSTGGKYFNAQDQYQLTRSLQKINRIYTPIATTQTTFVDAISLSVFQGAYSFITSTQQYDTALVLYKKFVSTYPADSAGQYNYALMCEANERYKTAVKYYELYLQSAPNDANRQFIIDRIALLKKDYEIYLAYSKKVILSDLAYLEQHFKQLQTAPNAVPLAGEFTGFIKEKQTFYRVLPETLEMEEPWLKQYAKEIAQAFKQATYFLSKNPKQWDLDGISMIGNIYEPLSRLAKKI